MKKKVKKIPKYNAGGSVLDTLLNNNQLITPAFNSQNNGVSSATAGTVAAGKTWSDMNNTQRTSAIVDAAGVVLNGIGNIGKPATLSGAIQGGLSGASTGAAIGGPLGAGIGFAAGTLFNSIGNKASTDGYGNYKKSTGITRLLGIGKSDSEIRQQANREKNAMISQQQTQAMRSDYYNENPAGSINVLAAEGGIMRKPVDALVSKGELIYDPTTKKLRQVPGSKGKPNKADDVYARLYEGDVVISNSPTMLMANGKTPAQNLMGMVDKYATGGTVKAREAIIKKVVNWQEANKTKPQEYAKFDGGGIADINKYGYNKNMSDFAYWDKDKNEYKKEYLDWVNNLTEQDVRDIESGKYGDMSEYFSKNKGKKLDVATAQKLMTDKKYGNWHKIGQAVVDNKIKNTEPKLAEPWQAKMSINGVGPLWQDMYKSNYPIDYTVTPIDMKLKTLPNPSAADGSRAARKYLSKQNTPNWLDEMSNLLPVIGGLFDKYDWHTESSQITPPRFVPVNADPRPLLRAADESLAMARYNQANISQNTGAGMAYGLQAASNRAKAYADAYQWQQETNNKLIAQNAGIYNDWRKQRDAYATQAIADTRANEGAAQQMKDQARKDRLEFYYGRRNDDMLTAMLEPMFEYGTPDKAYRQIYKRRIV